MVGADESTDLCRHPLVQILLCRHTVIKKYKFLFSFFLKKWANPGLFSSFLTHITNFTTNWYVKKYPSSIWHRDLNSQPSDYESPPLTFRPGLPPFSFCHTRNSVERTGR